MVPGQFIRSTMRRHDTASPPRPKTCHAPDLWRAAPVDGGMVVATTSQNAKTRSGRDGHVASETLGPLALAARRSPGCPRLGSGPATTSGGDPVAHPSAGRHGG